MRESGLIPSHEPVEVPFRDLSEAALRGVVEAFVLREGTDYGTYEFKLEDKVAQVIRQLEGGDARLMFEPKSGTIDVVRATAKSAKWT